MRAFTLVISLILSFVSYAEEIYPVGCIPLIVKDELISIPAASPRVVMIHNLGVVDLWITHPVSDPNTSARWSSHLQTTNWSALIINHASFKLSCIESKPGHEQQIACKNVVGVCEWKGTLPKIKKSNGIFWAAENMQLNPLIAYMGRQGFILPTSKIK